MQKLKKLALIGNAKAGKGSSAYLFRQGKRTLWGWPCEIFTPSSAKEVSDICRSLDPKVYEAALVAGGDGTIHWAIRGLVHSAVPLYPLPAGTANDLARQLGIDCDWKQVQRILDLGCKTRIDLIEANGVPFATVAGIGIGATLTSHFNAWRGQSTLFSAVARKLHNQIYTAMTLKTILTDSSAEKYIRIQAGSFDEKLKTSAVFICNQKTLGGDLTVAPHANNSDQRLEILVIPNSGKMGLIRALTKLKKAEGNSISKDFILFSSEKVTIQELKGRGLTVFGDGEIISQSNRVDFKILPHALSVYSSQSKGIRS